MNIEQLNELSQHRDGHFANETVGGSIQIYMVCGDGSSRIVATRSNLKSALALIRQRREAYAQGDSMARRECRSTVDRILAESRPNLQPTGS